MNTALINGKSQPWMYEILAIAMKIEDYPKKDIERVLLSRVDYSAKDFSSMLYSAAFLNRLDYPEQALALYRQASSINNQRPEPYLLGMDLARRLKNSDAIRWSTVGVLKYDWSKQNEKNRQKALLLAKEEIKSLQSLNKISEAKQFQNLVSEAMIRDLEIELVWSGNGELDFFIEEPGETVCSHENHFTEAGGVYLHDGYGPKPSNCYEKYVNREAPSGEYRIRVHQVNDGGRIVGNRATLKITVHKNTRKEQTTTQSVLIARTDSIVTFNLQSGRGQLKKE